MILLDTCTFLWLVSNPSQLSEHAKSVIAAHSGNMAVSAITAFEIALKVQKKKIILPVVDTMKWFASLLEFHGFREIPIDSHIAILSAQLPPHHRDPCDRIIVATAITRGMKCLTPDALIKQYSEVEVVW